MDLRSQLLPIGAPASACPRRHLLTGRPWRLVEASCTLGPALCTALVPSLPHRARRRGNPSRPTSFSSAGGIRTHDLELMRLARTASPLPRSGSQRREAASAAHAEIWPAGVEPAVSGSRNRRDGQASLQPGASTTVESNHAHPPHQSGAGPAGPSSSDISPGGVEPPLSTVGAWCSSTERRRGALSTGIEPASPGRQPGRVARRVRERERNRSGAKRPTSLLFATRDPLLRRTRLRADEAPRAGFEPASPT
jgi:hypothetical protein